MNNLKTKIDDLKVGKLKAIPVDLKKLHNVVDNEVVKSTDFKEKRQKLNVNNFLKKNSNATTLIHINQYNTYKKNLAKQIGDVDKKTQDTRGL